jgi:4-alpha-glucanotransferase
MTALRRLAELHGVETSFKDGLGRRMDPSPDVLLAVLRALGSNVTSPEDAAAAIREHRDAAEARLVEPVIVAWDGAAFLDLRSTPAGARPVGCLVVLEDGDMRAWRLEPDDGAIALGSPEPLPYGYHRLTIEDREATQESLIISAPRMAYRPPPGRRDWGIFAPLHAIHSANSWGIGDFGDLGRLLDWTSSLGGTTVATLPLLAAFTGGIGAISPYSPASRLFWNDLYIDVTAVPELAGCKAAREIVASADFRADLEKLRASSLVGYEAIADLKRRVLQPLAESMCEERSARSEAFRSYLGENPRLRDYARFRAACDRHRSGWRSWPETRRDGPVDERGIDAATIRYHTYVQWASEEQMTALSEEASEAGNALYLDMPLGVHADSYDTWSERESFADGVSGGAPPDVVFTGGQNWAFPPPHPQGARETGYRYLIASLRHVMRHASMLRIDHIAGLHRLFWIPAGMNSSNGVYVHYPAEELYAILTLESHRHRTVVVGEDLGTIPEYVRTAMADHGVLRSYVLEYELAGGDVPPEPDSGFVASVNTHDMEPFAAFWQTNRDTRPRSALVRRLATEGLVDGKDVSLAEAESAANAWLAASDAPLMLLSLEDLWHETERQNVPGTSETERPNWRRKTRHSLEEIREMPSVADSLSAVETARRTGTKRA